MKQGKDLSSEASRLLELVRDVPPLDGERRARMKRGVLTAAPPDIAGRNVASKGSKASTIARWSMLSAVVIAAAVATPWIVSQGRADVVASESSPARATDLADPPEAPVSEGELSPSKADEPAGPPTVPTVSSPHALGSAKEAKPDARHPAATGTVTVKAELAAESPSPAAASETALAAPPPETAPPAPIESPSSSSLQEEVRLVRSADAAVTAHEPARALALLHEHEQRFPQGVLASERNMLVVLALCAEGRDPEARALAERFKERSPNSPLLERLQRSCAGAGRP
jgi:hypothetical protein